MIEILALPFGAMLLPGIPLQWIEQTFEWDQQQSIFDPFTWHFVFVNILREIVGMKYHNYIPFKYVVQINNRQI